VASAAILLALVLLGGAYAYALRRGFDRLFSDMRGLVR